MTAARCAGRPWGPRPRPRRPVRRGRGPRGLDPGTLLTAVGVGLGVALLLVAAAVPAMLAAPRRPATRPATDIGSADAAPAGVPAHLLVAQANTTLPRPTTSPAASCRRRAPSRPPSAGPDRAARPRRDGRLPRARPTARRPPGNRCCASACRTGSPAPSARPGLQRSRRAGLLRGRRRRCRPAPRHVRPDRRLRRPADPREPIDPVLLLLIVIVFVVLLVPVGRVHRHRRALRRRAPRPAAGRAAAGRRRRPDDPPDRGRRGAVRRAARACSLGAGIFLLGPAVRRLGGRCWDISVVPRDVTPSPRSPVLDRRRRAGSPPSR